MLSFVIHSKPVLACYSSPDRLPLVTSSQRKGSLELSAVTQRCAGARFLFLFPYSAGASHREGQQQKKKARKKQESRNIFICLYLKSQNVPEAVALMFIPEVPGRAAGRSLFRQIAVRVRQ